MKKNISQFLFVFLLLDFSLTTQSQDQSIENVVDLIYKVIN